MGKGIEASDLSRPGTQKSAPILKRPRVIPDIGFFYCLEVNCDVKMNIDCIFILFLRFQRHVVGKARIDIVALIQ